MIPLRATLVSLLAVATIVIANDPIPESAFESKQMQKPPMTSGSNQAPKQMEAMRLLLQLLPCTTSAVPGTGHHATQKLLKPTANKSRATIPMNASAIRTMDALTPALGTASTRPEMVSLFTTLFESVVTMSGESLIASTSRRTRGI